MNTHTSNLIASGNYSVATIKRKSDNKIFSCYSRSGSVKILKDGTDPDRKHWFINGTDHEELCLHGVDTHVYDIIEVVEDRSHD